jgi:hypothetical protein
MTDEPTEPHSNYLAGVAFAALLAVIVIGVWAFPRLYAYMSAQDCIGSGRTNCVRYAPTGAASGAPAQ